jgi:hypothetical protein
LKLVKRQLEVEFEANDINLPDVPLDQGLPPTDGNRDENDHDGNNAANADANEDDEDDGDMAGPTVEAHVDLAKKYCKYPVAQYH